MDDVSRRVRTSADSLRTVSQRSNANAVHDDGTDGASMLSPSLAYTLL
jgi:hypothetical protein